MKQKPTARKKKGELLVTLAATVPPATRRRLVEIAKSEHRNVSQVVRVALEEFLLRRAAA